MKKVLILLALIPTFIVGENVYASEIGRVSSTTLGNTVCVGSIEDINSIYEATYACDSGANMGYINYLYTKPKYSVLSTLPSTLASTSKKDTILFFNGHANSNHMTWNSNNTGDYKTGITKLSNDTTDGYKFVKINNFSNVVLAIYMGCGTAQNSNDNLPKYGYENAGQKFTIGWSAQYIYDRDTDEWTKYFYDALKTATTVKKAIDKANSYNYRNNTYMKSTITFGRDRAYTYAYARNNELIDINTKLESKNIKLNKNSALNQNDNIKYIKENFDNNFNVDDYIEEVTTNKEQTIYTYSLKINGIKSNIGYTIIKSNVENNIELVNNMNDKNISQLKDMKKVENTANISEEELIMKALSKHNESKTIISYNSSQKYYDAVKDVLYFDVYLNSYDAVTNTNAVITESFEI